MCSLQVTGTWGTGDTQGQNHTTDSVFRDLIRPLRHHHTSAVTDAPLPGVAAQSSSIRPAKGSLHLTLLVQINLLARVAA